MKGALPVNFKYQVFAAAQAVEGVETVRVDRFRRVGDADGTAIEAGVVELGRLEIAELANDPSFPERGVLKVLAGGGS